MKQFKQVNYQHVFYQICSVGPNSITNVCMISHRHGNRNIEDIDTFVSFQFIPRPEDFVERRLYKSKEIQKSCPQNSSNKNETHPQTEVVISFQITQLAQN